MKIGIVVAVEIDSIMDNFGVCKKEEIYGKYKVFTYKYNSNYIYVIECGAGEIAASSATQLLISKYNVGLIFNFGVVGSLSTMLNSGDTCLVERVVHYDFDTSEVDYVEVGRYSDYPSIYIPTNKKLLKLNNNLNIPLVTCASGDKFIGNIDKKKELNKLYNADICDMESAGIVLTCDRNNIPCLLVKTVADSLNGSGEEYYQEKRKSSDICVDILKKMIDNYSR